MKRDPSTQLKYLMTDTMMPTSFDFISLPNFLDTSAKRQEIYFSERFSSEIARQFTAAHRYTLAATLTKKTSPSMSDAFYMANEDHRILAVKLIECARENGIELLEDYSDEIVKAKKRSKDMTIEGYGYELMSKEEEDSRSLEELLKMSKKLLGAEDGDVVSSLESIQESRVLWCESMKDMLSPMMDENDESDKMDEMDENDEMEGNGVLSSSPVGSMSSLSSSLFMLGEELSFWN